MDKISDEAKMVIASNLTVAALIRELILSREQGTPLHSTQAFVMDRFQSFISLLDETQSEE